MAEGDLEQVTALLQEGVSPNSCFKGWTPVMKAAEENHVEILRKLLDASADRDAVNARGGRR